MRHARYWPTRIVLLVLVVASAPMIGCRPGPVATSNAVENENQPSSSAVASEIGAENASEQTRATGEREEPSSSSPATPSNRDAKAINGGVDYTAFEAISSEPLRVPLSAFALCRPASSPADKEAQRARGPHYAPAVKFFANQEALVQLRSGKNSAMPVGATIVKEKWWDETASGPAAYGAMIKREAGYDPRHGDWEYVYVTLDEKPKIERGRVKNCIDCHATAEKRDYLFRKWKKVDEQRNDEASQVDPGQRR